MSNIRLILLLPAILLLAVPAQCILPLRDQWAAANRALALNQPQVAHQLFEEFNHWYAQEEVTRSPEFREKWYRLWGLSALQAGSVPQGIALLETWLEETAGQHRFRAFIRFQLASAFLAEGDTQSAVIHWSRFVGDHPGLPECGLVRWLWSDLLISQQRHEEALTHLETLVCDSQLPESGKLLAKSALAVVLLSLGRNDEAFAHLSSIPGNRASGIWKGILAPVLTDQFLKTGRYDLAREASGWFVTSGDVRSTFQDILRNQSARHGSVRQRIWSSHWSNQLGKAAAGMKSVEESGFSLKDLYLLRATALLKADAAMDAYVLSRFLLQSNRPDLANNRERSYACCIESCIALGNWEAAAEVTGQFLAQFPDNPGLPDIMFLQARTSAARKAWPAAVAQVDRLVLQFPGHRSVHSWKVAAAGWRIHAGRVAEALESLVQLEQECPQSWRSYLRFEQARCHEQLHQSGQAESLYREISSGDSLPMLSEQATIALMKIYLSRLDWSRFEPAWLSFREKFPHSNDLPTAGLLLGSFHEMSGRLDRAVGVYQDVAAGDHPQSAHAHRQLSRIHASRNDFTLLREHALAWISQAQAHSGQIPSHAMGDCLLYQRQTHRPALPDSLVSLLLDNLRNDEAGFPCSQFLEILEDRWDAYAPALHAGDTAFGQWLGALADELYSGGRYRSWPVITLHSAVLLERSGRGDSADSKRIQILTTIDPDNLNSECLFEVAETAYRYDFPECGPLLERYMELHGASQRAPECLRMMALLDHRSGETLEAIQTLETITLQWPDSDVFNAAALQLAHWQFEADMPDEADRTISTILGSSAGLTPPQVAGALLLRARIDLHAGRHGRCLLNCERILTLYPDIHDISEEARRIAESVKNA